MIEFIINNIWAIIVGILVLLLVAICIYNRKALKKKIKQESISFVAMVFSILMALISFISKPDAIPVGTASLIQDGKFGLAFSITAFFIVLSIATIIYFFRRELIREV